MGLTTAPARIDRDVLALEIERLDETVIELQDRVDRAGHFPTPRDAAAKDSVDSMLLAAHAALQRAEGVATGDLEPLSRAEQDLVYVSDVILTGHARDLDNDGRAVKNAIRLIVEPA
jgi:hypothetical protein